MASNVTMRPAAANMLGLASILRVQLIELCFAARLGRLPRPIGRDEYGWPLFDIAEAQRRMAEREGAA